MEKEAKTCTCNQNKVELESTVGRGGGRLEIEGKKMGTKATRNRGADGADIDRTASSSFMGENGSEDSTGDSFIDRTTEDGD